MHIILTIYNFSSNILDDKDTKFRELIQIKFD